MNIRHLANEYLFILTSKRFFKKRYETVIINLALGVDTILRQSDKNSVRKNIQRSKNHGVTISKLTFTLQLREYAKILYQSRMRLGIEVRTQEELFKEILQLAKMPGYCVHMAFWNGVAVGAVGSRILNRKITEQGIVRTLIDHSEKLYCIDALRWNLILYGIEKGCLEYDLGGIENITDKQKGIAKNKLKWNGEICGMVKYV